MAATGAVPPTPTILASLGGGQRASSVGRLTKQSPPWGNICQWEMSRISQDFICFDTTLGLCLVLDSVSSAKNDIGYRVVVVVVNVYLRVVKHLAHCVKLRDPRFLLIGITYFFCL